jgi:threonine synthase
VTAFVAATNANTTVPDYLDSGEYRPRPSVTTIANAMDVGAPSNWERIEHLFRHDLKAMRHSLRWASLSDDGTRAEIRWLFDRGYLADPHGALACAILRQRKHSGEVGVFLATAHPAKFASALAPVLGASLETALPLPPALAEVAALPLQTTAIANDIAALRAILVGPSAT